MALRQKSCVSRLPALALIGLAAFAGLNEFGFGTGFVGAAVRARTAPHLAKRTAYESGKVNLDTEIKADAAAPPAPVIECDESCMSAILDCLEEGCSVEALAKLDQRLAADEQKIASTMEEIQSTQKTAYSEENMDTLAWLGNFLDRSSSLRAQLQALRGFQDSDFVKQMVKAASVAFGGGRKGDYPKVGVSSYSA